MSQESLTGPECRILIESLGYSIKYIDKTRGERPGEYEHNKERIRPLEELRNNLRCIRDSSK
jgi:hypothetical protein